MGQSMGPSTSGSPETAFRFQPAIGFIEGILPGSDENTPGPSRSRRVDVR